MNIDIIMHTETEKRQDFSYKSCRFCCAPGGRTFQRVQVPNPPGSGKDIANGKGVVGDCESEGSRMANLWSDEQKSHKATVKDKVAVQTEVQ